MSHVVSAPAAAVVEAVVVEAGQKVAADDAVLVLAIAAEQRPAIAGVCGTVTEVLVQAGESVEADTPLLIIAEEPW